MALRDVAVDSGIVNNSMIYFAVRRLNMSVDKKTWWWYWITYDQDDASGTLKLVKSASNAQYDATTIIPPANALFRVKMESGPYIINPRDKSKSPESFWDESNPDLGRLPLEQQLRFTLQSPSGLNVGNKSGKLGLGSKTPIIFKLNWFSTQTWKGIVDFGMSFSNNITLSDYTGLPNGRSAYPQSVWASTDSQLAAVQEPMHFLSVDNPTNEITLMMPTDVKTQTDVGTLNFRMLLQDCVTQSPRMCTFTLTPGMGRKPFDFGDINPNMPKSTMACTPNQVSKCVKLAASAAAVCGAAAGIAGFLHPTSAPSVARSCFTNALNKVGANCVKCACQAMGCPAMLDSYCAKHGCGGQVSAPLMCHKDSDCMFVNTNGVKRCVVNDPDNRNKDWQTDYCQLVQGGGDFCACTNPDPDVPELQCASDDQCTSTKKVTDWKLGGYDEGLTKHAKYDVQSSAQCGMQQWRKKGTLYNQFYYGGPVCNNPSLSSDRTCLVDQECQSPADGGGMIGDERTRLIGRGCNIVYDKKGKASTVCTENKESSCAAPCQNGGVCSSITGVCECPPGWTGDDCSMCDCKNGGVCSSATGVCECPPSWTGDDCSICACKNGGVCSSTTGVCECPPGWTGPDCGICACKNGGVCSSTTGQCECPPGWDGPDCGECTKQCRNGGRCSNATGTCMCKNGFIGASCEQNTCPAGGHCFTDITDWRACKPSAKTPLCSAVKGDIKQTCCLSDEVTFAQIGSACPVNFKADPKVDYCSTGMSKYRVKCVREFCK